MTDIKAGSFLREPRGHECHDRGSTKGTRELAVVTASLSDGTGTTFAGGSSKIFLSGQAGSLALMAIRNNPTDTGDVLLEVKVSSGTVHVRAATHPDSESATLIVNNVRTGTFIDLADSQLGADFPNSTDVFSTLLAVHLQPEVDSTLQMFGTINFTWSA